MKTTRICSQPTCGEPAVACLTYNYADATAVIGPMPTRRQPYAYELCEHHVQRFTAPRGWQVIRLATNFEPAPPSVDDLYALADVVRQAGSAKPPRTAPAAPTPADSLRQTKSAAKTPEWGPFTRPTAVQAKSADKHGPHLRVVRDDESDASVNH